MDVVPGHATFTFIMEGAVRKSSLFLRDLVWMQQGEHPEPIYMNGTLFKHRLIPYGMPRALLVFAILNTNIWGW
jgi:hypothetical protein